MNSPFFPPQLAFNLCFLFRERVRESERDSKGITKTFFSFGVIVFCSFAKVELPRDLKSWSCVFFTNDDADAVRLAKAAIFRL